MPRNKHNVDYSQKILEVKNLKQHFKVGMGKRRIIVKAVDGIDFDIYKREVFGLVGESGCGKTTTGRTIIKLYNPTDGEVIYNGRTIGMGHEGLRMEAKQVKRTAAQEILFLTPYKKKRRDLKEQYKFERLHLRNLLAEETKKYNQEIDTLCRPIKDYKQALRDLKDEYNSNRAEIQYDENTEINQILSEGIIPILLDRKHYLKASKKRFKDKVEFIQSMKIEKYDKDQQISSLREDYDKEIESIEKDINKKLEIQGIDIISNDVRNQIKARVKEEKASKKEAIKASSLKYLEKQNAIKEKYLNDLEELKANEPARENLSEQKAAIKENYNNEAEKIKLEMAELKHKHIGEMQVLKQDYKDNPEKYEKDLEKINEIKEERNAKIKELREKIRLAKTRNKLKELPEERQARLEKKREITNSYKDAVEQINKKFEGKENGQAKKELAEARKEYREKLDELESNRPNFTNYVSSMQMIFQDPISSLNPRMIVSDIISEGLRIKGEKNKNTIREKVYEVLSLVGLDRGHATRYPHEFSGGQRQRIGVARAIIVNPDLLIADEPISALDVSIQAQVINLLNDLKERLGLTILFIAHDLSVVKYFSDRIAVMYMGKIVELASAKELFDYPLHPYTKSLLSAIPYPDPQSERNRKRVLYNPMMHDYSVDKPSMREIKDGHFIYANEAEYKMYLKELGKGGK